jgi:hypothetical protein
MNAIELLLTGKRTIILVISLRDKDGIRLQFTSELLEEFTVIQVSGGCKVRQKQPVSKRAVQTFDMEKLNVKT